MSVNIINEKQVIEFLRQRESMLEQELLKIRTTISVIDSSSLVLENIVSAGKVLPTEQPTGKSVIRKRLKPVGEFLVSGKLDEKISYAITKMKTAYKEDIIEVLIENQPSADIVKLQNAVGVRLSYLLKNDMIVGEKHGRKFSYSLY